MLDLSLWPDDVKPVLSFQMQSQGLGLSACRNNCSADFEPGASLDRCNEFCECIHKDNELDPTLGTIIRCAIDIQKKALAPE